MLKSPARKGYRNVAKTKNGRPMTESKLINDESSARMTVDVVVDGDGHRFADETGYEVHDRLRAPLSYLPRNPTGRGCPAGRSSTRRRGSRGRRPGCRGHRGLPGVGRGGGAYR